MLVTVTPYEDHCQVRIGDGSKGYLFSRSLSYKIYGGRKATLTLAWDLLYNYCDTHGIIPPVKGWIKNCQGEPAFKNSKSGIPGVYYSERGDKRRPNASPLSYWEARYWKIIGGKKKLLVKRYSVKKLGEAGAKSAAISFREDWEKSIRDNQRSHPGNSNI